MCSWPACSQAWPDHPAMMPLPDLCTENGDFWNVDASQKWWNSFWMEKNDETVSLISYARTHLVHCKPFSYLLREKANRKIDFFSPPRRVFVSYITVSFPWPHQQQDRIPGLGRILPQCWEWGIPEEQFWGWVWGQGWRDQHLLPLPAAPAHMWVNCTVGGSWENIRRKADI